MLLQLVEKSGYGIIGLGISNLEISVPCKIKNGNGDAIINILAEICEECVKAKQHKEKFSKGTCFRTKCHLEVVYSDVCGQMKVDSIGGNR